MKNNFIVVSIFLIIMTISWSSCKKSSDPETETFIIQVDSIIHPDTINFGDNLTIKF